MLKKSNVVITLAVVMIMLFTILPQSASASHFRFGHHTWNKVDGTANTVRFNLKEAWRLNAGSVSIRFGDGRTFSGRRIVSQPTDLAGLKYDVHEMQVIHTYPHAGPFTTSKSSCCRIFGLVNANSSSFDVQSVVDMRNGQTSSTVSSIPPILQMKKGLNSIALPVADADGGAITCRMATSGESRVPSVASAGGNALSVSSSCVLDWDASAAVNKSKYAAQVAIFEGGLRTALDFIIEINAGLVDNDPPSCELNGPASSTISVGSTFSISANATDPEGRNLRVNHLGLPSGATLTPADGSSVASPATATFDWTPTSSGATAITILFTDDGNQTCQSSFAINVPSNAPPEADAGSDSIVEQEGPTGSDITLDGSGSTDADGDPLTYSWTGPFGTASGSNPTVLIPGGTHTITLTVDDGQASDSDTVVITVSDSTPPVLITTDASMEATAEHTPFDVSNNASATDAVGVFSLENDAPASFPVGVTVVNWEACDAAGNCSQGTQSVTVVDSTPPAITNACLTDKLWPPNHKLVLVSSGSVSDLSDPNPTISIDVTSNQPINSTGDGNTNPDWTVNNNGGSYGVSLRAERSGNLGQRDYGITLTATDVYGNSSTASCSASVPHDQGSNNSPAAKKGKK
jgi:hypothetical protein